MLQGAMQRQQLAGQQQMQQRSAALLRPTRLASSRAAARRVNRSSWAPRAATMDAPTEQQGSTGQVENVCIVGSGPAGYSAAVYAARALLKPVCFEGFQAGRGGQLMGTTEVENYPGFPEGVTGPELMDRMRAQAERWGTELYTEDVEHLDLSQRPFVIRSNEREVRAHSVIIATGATARRLGIPSEQTFWSKGISACAICDGASPLFKNKPVAVVGGGDSAAEEAVYLTKYTPEVHMLVRGDKLRASKTMQDRALNSPKITVHFNTEVEDATGDGLLSGLKLYNNKTGEKSHMSVNGMFYGIGHRPNSDLLQGQVELDEKGYVKVRHGVSTNIDGVFAAGDLHDPEWRQAVTAAGSGCMAALSAERYLTANNLAIEFKPKEQPAHAPEEQAAPSTSGSDEVSFDPSRNKHKGQFALRKLYHETDKLIAVLYTSPTCGPCRSLKPIFSGVADEYADKMYYIEIDIEADPEIAEAAGVAGTPTLQFFKQKDLLRQVPGVKQKREYREMINQFV